jgi:hypothetical protein
MKGLGTLVECLDEETELGCAELLDELLYKIATRHHPFGLKEKDLKVSRNVIDHE